MERGGNIGKLILAGAIAFGGWWVYDHYYTPPGIVQDADRAMLAGRYRDAADLYEQASWEDPDNMRLQLKLGEAYFYLGQKGLSASHYRQAEPLLQNTGGSIEMSRHEERYNILRAEGF